jgi:hypothetical protein
VIGLPELRAHPLLFEAELGPEHEEYQDGGMPDIERRAITITKVRTRKTRDAAGSRRWFVFTNYYVNPSSECLGIVTLNRFFLDK